MNHDPDSGDEGRELWAELAADVTPLDTKSRRAPGGRALEPVARMRIADEAQVMHEALHGALDPALLETGDETSYLRPGWRASTLRKLRRGRFRIQSEIDLHGHNRAEARTAVAEFLGDCVARNLGCVRIIHGKGLRSPRGEPVLKSRIERSLRQDERVLAYASAPPWLGGHGALLVLLRTAA